MHKLMPGSSAVARGAEAGRGMTASNHPSPMQFPRMSIRQLKLLQSVEGGTVGSRLPGKLADVTETEPYASEHWNQVRDATQHSTIDPVHVVAATSPGASDKRRYGRQAKYAHPMMDDGHHRLAIAEAMGETTFPVSNNKADVIRHGRGEEWRLARVAQRQAQREAGE